jgi:hypothetical protein
LGWTKVKYFTGVRIIFYVMAGCFALPIHNPAIPDIEKNVKCKAQEALLNKH